MVKVKGIYDGVKVVLLEPISLPPNTAVDVVILQEENNEQLYWKQLMELGLVKEVQSQTRPPLHFVPVAVSGKPVSETILEERR